MRNFIIKIIIVAIVSTAGWFLGDLIRSSDGVVALIAAIYSILAAALFAVITVIGDPSSILKGGKAVAWTSGQQVYSRIKLLNILFVFYMFTLGLLLAGEIIETAKYEKLYWVFNLIGYLTIFCFLCSLNLSFALTDIQKRKLEGEIESR